MYWLTHPFVWLSRIGKCRGFSIQSPTDYWIVRYVINEHWPYYQYSELGKDHDTLRRKLGFLYFRIANWLQPEVIESDDYLEYLHAGCCRASFGPSVELIFLSLDGDSRNRLLTIYDKVLSHTVLVVEGINRHYDFWREMVNDVRTGVTFDLYYCGIVMFDKQRYKQNYIINF